MANTHSDQISLTAAADLSAKQNLFAKVSGNNGCDACGAGQDAIGVINAQTKATSGLPCAIDVGPVVKITLAATLSAGAEVMSDANAKAVAWVTANRSLGYLLEGGVSGDVVKMLFTQGGRKA
jgi:hypothetical protein